MRNFFGVVGAAISIIAAQGISFTWRQTAFIVGVILLAVGARSAFEDEEEEEWEEGEDLEDLLLLA